MVDAQVLSKIQEMLEQFQSFLVVYPGKQNPDIRAAAEAVVASLQDSGKDAKLFSPRKPQDIPGYPTSEDIQAHQELGNQNLTISFEYTPEKVDKVSYHISEDSKKFYLTVKPQKNVEPLDTKSVEFAYTGAEADVIIAVGVAQLEELEQLYFGYEDLYESTPTISLNMYEVDYAQVQVIPVTAPSLSQEVSRLLFDTGLTVPSEAATQLLYGVETATDSLRSHLATAETFDVVANLLRLGARRLQPPKEPSTQQEKPVHNVQSQSQSLFQSEPKERQDNSSQKRRSRNKKRRSNR